MAGFLVAAGFPDEAALEELRRFETQRRAALDFGLAPTSNRVMGPNPFAVIPASSGENARLYALLRGRDELLVLESDLSVVQSLSTPPSPTGLTRSAEGEVFVSGELSASVLWLREDRGGRLERVGLLEISDVVSVRDVAVGAGGTLYLIEEVGGRLITVKVTREGGRPAVVARRECAIGRGPFQVKRHGDLLIVNCLLDHTLRILTLDEEGWPHTGAMTEIRHDGPIWCFAAKSIPGGFRLAAGGVEDRPLDRSGGFFGYVDSFVYLYDWAGPSSTAPPQRVRAINTSMQGLVTPKWLHFLAEPAKDGADVLMVTGYGGSTLLTVELTTRSEGPNPLVTKVTARAFPPGTTAMARSGPDRWVAANPLLDAWVTLDANRVDIHALPGTDRASRSWTSHLGEVLFFTTLMAPENSSRASHSRFTCETCHFEGYVDGRIHYTGRGEVHATTKPLLGLFNNKPHFSRALDRDLTQMVNNEFRVAGAESGSDPWFTLPVLDYPWLAPIVPFPIVRTGVPPPELRRALMTFLMDFTHSPNPSAAGRSRWSREERNGATAFRTRCEGCHRARLIADDPSSAVPFQKWESLILQPQGAIVWGSADYAKTGVEPYVHENGARVPSLRRLYKKGPYFTNGSAADLESLLEMVRFGEGRFLHAATPAGDDGLRSLDTQTRIALRAFLELL